MYSDSISRSKMHENNFTFQQTCNAIAEFYKIDKDVLYRIAVAGLMTNTIDLCFSEDVRNGKILNEGELCQQLWEGDYYNVIEVNCNYSNSHYLAEGNIVHANFNLGIYELINTTAFTIANLSK